MNAGKNPRVSVIVPIYNVEKYLPECLESLVNQNYPKECYEILCINDGSPDNSQNIVDEYAEKYPGLVVSFIKENGGVADARNYGVEKANGEYIGWLDPDDIASPDMLSLLMERAEQTNSDIVVCRIYRFQEKKEIKNIELIEGENGFGNSVVNAPCLLIGAKPYVWNKVFRKKLFTDNNIRFPIGRYYEDSAIVYNLLLTANRVELVDEPLIYYRDDRDGSITNTYDTKFFDIFNSINSIVSFYKARGAYETCKEELREICRMLCYARINRFVHSPHKKLVFKFFDEAFKLLDKQVPGWRKNKYFIDAMKLAKKENQYKIYDVVKNTKPLLKLAYIVGKRWKNYDKNIGNSNYTKQQIVEMAQGIHLDIIDTIDEVCRKNGLKYFLVEGSLLGAVRHEGFIPWDDDIDIAMPREDYEKFLKIWGKQKIDGCLLLHQSTYKKYHLTFSKIVTTLHPEFTNTNVHLPDQFKSLYVDVFPLDKGLEKEPIWRYNIVRAYRDILLFKVKFPMSCKYKRQYILKAVAPIVPFRFLQSRIQRYFKAYKNKKKAQHIVNFASSYKPVKETFPADAFERQVWVKFENRTLPIPANADLVLRTIYGDYMEMPPENKRVPRHDIQYIKESKTD